MSELKAVHAFDVYEAYTKTGDDDAAQVYIKSEADKVIAELEESHKMEVGQLLMEIVELKKNRDTAEKLLNKALDCVSNGKNHMMSLARKKNHADYKRCMAMAKWCMARYNEWVAYYPTTTTRKMKFLDRWEKRWLALAEKFKEAK